MTERLLRQSINLYDLYVESKYFLSFLQSKLDDESNWINLLKLTDAALPPKSLLLLSLAIAPIQERLQILPNTLSMGEKYLIWIFAQEGLS